MSPLLTALLTAAGVAMILAALRDIFDALLQPEGRGTLAATLTRVIWGLSRRGGSGHRAFVLAGPLALATVIVAWAGLLAVGWALVYLPQIPDGFRFDPGVTQEGGRLVEALHVSLVTLTTLGFGDVTPQEPWLRLLVPVEALLGFGLLTATVSWILLIYPVLSRRRSLAYEISLLRAAERDHGVALERLPAESAERLYAELISRLVAVERDLVHFPITYYYAERDARFSLPAVAPYLLDLARRGAAPEAPEAVRVQALLLLEAVEDLATTTGMRFHGSPGDSAEERLESYARDHLRSPAD